MRSSAGFILIGALLLLGLMTVFGLITMQRAITDQKLLSNISLQQQTFGAAEQMMIYCQRQLETLWRDPDNDDYLFLERGLTHLWRAKSGLVILPYSETDWQIGNAIAAADGSLTAAPIPARWRDRANWDESNVNRLPARMSEGLNRQQACLIEQWRLTGAVSAKPDLIYLITVRAHTAEMDSEVWLQSELRLPERTLSQVVQLSWRQLLYRGWER